MFFGIFRRKPTIEFGESEKVELELKGEGEEEDSRMFLVEVLAYDAKTITVTAPKSENQMLELPEESSVTINVEREEYTGTFETQVLFVDKEASPPTLQVAQPADVSWEETEKVAQRRRFVRLEIALPVDFRTQAGLARSAVTSDLSGSGLAMMLALSLPEGSGIALKLHLPQKTVTVGGRIIKVAPIQGAPGKYRIAINFANITEADQDTIMRFIFEKQRELRRRGLM
ncbi:MAG: PilZ domain-containing protein [Armatimonadetes bacterium]|nr:PilZ domain-containing protein [Armatimonadota bacterium]